MLILNLFKFGVYMHNDNNNDNNNNNNINNISNNKINLNFNEKVNNLKKIFKENNNILFLCHHNADPDAIGSAIALKYLATTLNKNKSEKNFIISANSVSKISKNILSELNEHVEIIYYPKLLDVICFVDTSSLNQVMINKNELQKHLENNKNNTVIIDHHRKTDLAEICNLEIVNENYTSNCELVAQLFREINIYPPKSIRIGLLCGIVYDTKHLKLANEKTFNIISWLIKDISFQKILYLLTQESDEGKKIAHLKACSRAQIKIIEQNNQKYILALSNASSYESSCAKTLVSIGADIAFVVAYRKRDKEIRISSRCRKSIGNKVHLGELMEKLAKELNGEGGGHREAAGLNIIYKGNNNEKEKVINEILNKCVEQFENELKIK